MVSYFQLFDKSDPHKVPEDAKHFHFPYCLDDFQEEGMYRIHHRENILVTAHTGSGKTTFALYAIGQAFATKKRVIYTSPIKSLSNQKYAEFKKLFGAEHVGILTGDIKMNPEARCVIMTTEVLRNMLYKTDEATIAYMESVDSVIFDEVHYINDKDRGKVWEEVIIMLPREIILVMLSATIEGAEDFSGWVGRIKERNTMLIPTSHRVVPLQHYLFDYDAAQVYHQERRAREVRRMEEMKKSGLECADLEDMTRDEEKYDFPWKLVMNAKSEMEPMAMIRKGYKKYSAIELLDPLVYALHHLKRTPALFFVFSRKQCEHLAHMVHITMIDHNTRSKIVETFNHYMSPFKSLYDTLPQYHDVFELIQQGIAYHHSGMLPILKEIVEILFGLGYIKILFATETFAVGVNMPTKTVIFTSLEKYDNDGLRYINHAEYSQMSGRAGRRGLDPVGNVILMPQMDLPSDAIFADILCGKSPRVQSRFVPTYQFILKQLSNETGGSDHFLESTYFMEGHQKRSLHLMEEYAKLASSRDMSKESSSVEEYIKLKSKLSGGAGAGLGAFFVMKPKDKHKIEKELESLRKKYPNIEDQIAKYEERKKISDRMDQIKSEMDEEGTFLFQNIERMKELLHEIQYIESTSTQLILTKKGKIGMNINECNELLFGYMIDTYQSNREIDYAMWIGLFGLFIEEKGKNEPTHLQLPGTMKRIIRDLEEKSTYYANMELQYGISIGTKYELSYEYVEVLYQWAQGCSYGEILASHPTLFDGNFVKVILRVQNIVEDVKNICKITENYELLQLFENAEIPLLRDIAQVNSLYIKM